MSGIEAVQGRIAQIQGQMAAVAGHRAIAGAAAVPGGAAAPGAAPTGGGVPDGGVQGGGISGAGTAGDFARTLVGAQSAASAASAPGGLTVTRAAPDLDRSLLARPAALITVSPSGGAPAAPVATVRAPAAPAPPVAAPGAGVPAAPAPSGSSGSSRYDGLFAAATQRYGLPQGLLRAVAVTESGLKPDAVSRAGARGLMQIMPGTARALKVDPFDPAQAVDGAARLLRDHLKAFGSLELALAAYNAGPGAVRKHDGIPPYAETQSYVRKVTALLAQGAPR